MSAKKPTLAANGDREAKPKRKRAPGAGRKPNPQKYIRRTVHFPPDADGAISDATLPGETRGETIARRFGWEPR